MVHRLAHPVGGSRESEASPGVAGASAAPGPTPARLRVSILNAWANINRAGDSNLFHDHPQAVLSGVYYVRSPGDT